MRSVPPFLVCFSTKEKLVQALRASIDESEIEAISALVDQKLPPLTSIRTLACLFGLTPGFLFSLLYNIENEYGTFLIRKSKNNYRTIYAPKVGLKMLQRWFGFHLARAIPYSNIAHGFVPGRSVLSAAETHVNALWVLSFDIKDFFQTTPHWLIFSALKNLGYSEESSELICKLCCLNSHLTQGSPASPPLSNLVFYLFDLKIQKLAEDLNVRVSRYADDITFSGTSEIPQDLAFRFKALMSESPWKLSDDKEHFSKAPHRRKVHGLLVHNSRPSLTKGYRKRIRMYKFLIEKHKEDLSNPLVINGHLAYAKSIEKDL